MSAMEINKLVAAVLTAGLIFMVINVGVDEALDEGPLEQAAYPVPGAEGKSAAEGGRATAEAATAPPSLATLLAAADIDNGKKVARKCLACHDVKQGGRNKIGPNLWGVVGADKAAREGFAYSGALAGLGGAWGYADLDAFLAKPKEFARGTKMAFAGVKSPADRADLIAYLRSLPESPPPLPEAP